MHDILEILKIWAKGSFDCQLNTGNYTKDDLLAIGVLVT